MRLPEIRDRLHVLADDLAAAGMGDKAATLRTLADETKRRRAVRRTRAKAHLVTDQTRDRIHTLARANPDWSMFEIGEACGVNQGRVSEVLAGFRR